MRAPNVMAGYSNRPAETAAALTADGWLRTGDGGFVDAEGYLFLTDRVKDMIVSGGENIYPIEVEEVLSRHAGVRDVTVIGVPDARWGEAVKALVIAAPGARPATADLVAFARARWPATSFRARSSSSTSSPARRPARSASANCASVTPPRWGNLPIPASC